jgi:hypothetical protein
MFYYVKDLVVAIACCAISGKLGLRVTRQGSVDLVSFDNEYANSGYLKG